MPRSRYKVVPSEKAPYFITSSVVNWISVFGNKAIAKIILDSLDHLRRDGSLEIYGYVLMENHLHMVVSSPDLSSAIRRFKSFTARKCIDWYIEHDRRWILQQLRRGKDGWKGEQEFQFWQEGFHPKLIQDDVMLENKLDYIHNNPVERGYVDDPAHWVYSSYRNYMEMDAVLEIDFLW